MTICLTFRFDYPALIVSCQNGVMVTTTTWGLDMSTRPAKTAAVALEWDGRQVRVAQARTRLTAEDMVTLIHTHQNDWWAIDVPFGWPDGFVQLMQDRHHKPLVSDALPEDWNRWRTREVAQRRTDIFVTEHPQVRTRPLPASFQMLGATAAMWVLIEAKLAQSGVPVDRAGLDGRICETYPSAALAAWGHQPKGKPTRESLKRLLSPLDFVNNHWPLFENDDVCDALVCALAARARERGITLKPPNEDIDAARREGWIHISCEPVAALL